MLSAGCQDVGPTGLLSLPSTLLEEHILLLLDDASLCCLIQTCRPLRAAAGVQQTLWLQKTQVTFVSTDCRCWLRSDATGCFALPRYSSLAPVTHK